MADSEIIASESILFQINGNDPDFICEERNNRTLFSRCKFNSSFLSNYINNRKENYLRNFVNSPTRSQLGFPELQYKAVLLNNTKTMVPSLRAW